MGKIFATFLLHWPFDPNPGSGGGRGIGGGVGVCWQNICYLLAAFNDHILKS